MFMHFFVVVFQGPVSVTTWSTDTLVRYVGDSIDIEGCRFVSNFTNGISTYWLKNGTVLNTNNDFTSVWNGRYFLISVVPLNLKNLNFSNSGSYSCRLTYITTTGTQNVQSDHVYLHVQSKHG